MISRRRFLWAGGLGAVAPGLMLRVSTGAPAADHPLASFDHEVQAFMESRAVPGAALAVAKDGRIVYARGYGWADREQKIAVQPETLFRIASISKPFTSAAIFKLIERKKLDLRTRAFELLDWEPLPAAKGRRDPRLAQITIRQLLDHTGGWDRDRSGDPMFRSRAIAKAAGTEPPAMANTVVRYMLGQPLDFDPGTRSVYSNFGYCVLGRVIEKVSGRPYEEFVREQILTPMGIKDMRLGASLKSMPGESHYYTPNNVEAQSVFGAGEKVPEPYGGFCLEAMDSHGAWLASAPALARLAIGLDFPGAHPVLTPELLAQMYAPPAAPVSRKPDGSLEAAYYACGWNVRPIARVKKSNYWHGGSLPGTSTLLVRRWDGLSWAVLFNQRSGDKQLPDGAIDAALHHAADAVKEWPKESHDS